MNNNHKKKDKIKIVIGMEDSAQKEEIVEILSQTYSVETASDSEEAYHLIHKFDPDLVILDYSLSKMHPIDLHNGISFIHSYMHLVICVTSDNLEVARRVWHRRAMDFIFKPYHTVCFVQDVNKIVRYILDKRELDKLHRRIKAMEDELKEIKKEKGIT